MKTTYNEFVQITKSFEKCLKLLTRTISIAREKGILIDINTYLPKDSHLYATLTAKEENNMLLQRFINIRILKTPTKE